MTIRTKAFLIIHISVAASILIIFLFSRFILLSSSERLENLQASRNVGRVLGIIKEQERNLGDVAREWASEKSIHALRRDWDRAGAPSGLGGPILANLGIDLLAAADRQGGLAAARVYDARLERRIPPSPGLAAYLEGRGLPAGRLAGEQPLTGLIRLKEGLLLAAVAPFASGRGALIIGRRLDRRWAERLAAAAQVKVRIHLADAALPPNLARARDRLQKNPTAYAGPRGPETAAGYALLRDIRGEPALLLEALAPRTIWKQAQAAIQHFLLLLLAAGVLTSAAAFFFTHKVIVRRFSWLRERLGQIGSGGDPRARVGMRGDDELAELAGKVDGVLEALEQTQRERKRTEELYRAVTETSSSGIFIVQDNRFRYMNPAGERICGYSLEELRDMDFWEMVHPDHREAVRRAGLERQRGEMDSAQYEFKIVNPRRGERWLDFNATPINYQGRPALLGTAFDITARKQAQEEVHQRQEWSRITFEHTGTAMVVINADADMIMVNDTFAELSGYSREEIEGKMSWRDFVDPEMLPLMDEYHRMRREGGPAPQGYEFTFRDRRGRKRRVWNTVGTIPGADLSIASLIDITERKEAERRLRESEERYRSLVENTPLGLVICEARSGRFVFVNQRLCQMFGYRQEESLRLTFWDVTDPREHDMLKKRIAGRLKCRPASVSSIYTGVRKDGSTLRFQTTFSMVEYEGKSCLQGFIRDVTEEEMMQAQMQHAQKMDALGAMAGGVAHEFNNLLTGIRGYTQLLQSKRSGDDLIVNYLSKIDHSARQAADLTASMLSFTRLEKGSTQMVDATRAVRNARDLLEHTLPPNIELRLELPSRPYLVDINPSHLEQVLVNLALNARDAMPQGGRITFRAAIRRAGDEFRAGRPWARAPFYVEISVADTGQGIAPEAMGRIFDPFFTTKEPGKGTGLGLSLTYSMIKNYGGEIEVENLPDRGARFTVFLPADLEARLPEPSPRAQALPAQGQGRRVLVVDDEAAVREITREALTAFGYRTEEAVNGKVALTLYRQALEAGRPFALVIMDLSMPVMDGRQCMRRLFEMDPGARVVVATGHVGDQAALGDELHGAAGILAKPFDLSALLEAAGRILGDDPSPGPTS